MSIVRRCFCISIHAPREGGDFGCSVRLFVCLIFQSTPPARGATLFSLDVFPAILNFNPRPPRGGRLAFLLFLLVRRHFNPRPPRGGRLRVFTIAKHIVRFQSTPPARGATPRSWAGGTRRPSDFNPRPPRGGRQGLAQALTDRQMISIHAPREGGDVIIRRLAACGL